jgi:hypothetical protein
MVVAHIAGQGAPELVRFFKEPPLVREPDIALFGLSRVDPGEQRWMDLSPMRKFTPDEVRELGPVAAAEAALERIHIFKRQWVLHFDVDVLAASEMPATYYPAADGLRGEEFAEALGAFVSNANLAAVTLASYVPSADADGAAAACLLDLFTGAMAARIRALTEVKQEKVEATEVGEVQQPSGPSLEAAPEELGSTMVAAAEASAGGTLGEAFSTSVGEASAESVSEAPSEASESAGEMATQEIAESAGDSAEESAGDPVSEEKSEGV